MGCRVIVDLEVGFGDDTEILAGTLHAPVEVWVGGGRDMGDIAVGEHDSHVNDVVKDQTVVAHVSAEATTKARAELSCAATVGSCCLESAGTNDSDDSGTGGWNWV